MRVEYEQTSLSRRAVSAYGDVDYEYEGGFTFEEFIEQLQQRCQISRGDRCYDISWHEPSGRVFIHEVSAEGYSNEYFLTSPGVERLTLRKVLEALELRPDCAKLDWSIEEDANLDNLLDAPVESAPLNQLSICNQ